MAHNTRLQTVILTIAVIGGIFTLKVLSSYVVESNRQHVQILDEHGRKVALLFGDRPNVKLAQAFGTQAGGCNKPVTSMDRVKNLLSRTFSLPVAHATGLICQQGNCGGHYFTIDFNDCPPACGGVYWIVEANGSNYNKGWRYDGTIDCGTPCQTCSVELCDT